MSVEGIEQQLQDLNVKDETSVPTTATEEQSGEEQESSPKSSENQAASLYVGELASNVTEAVLFEVFSTVGELVSVHVCRDDVTKRSLGYGYVNFQNSKDAERSIEELNYTPVKGRPIRIMWSQRNPTLRRSQQGNIFIKNLDPAIDNKSLHDTFSAFGHILSSKVALDENGNSKGFGFVHYEEAESAKAAIENINGMLLNGREVFVGPHISRQDRASKLDKVLQNFTNVFIKNIDLEATQDELTELFKPFGAITSLKLEVDAEGKSKGFGFVNFEEHESAVKAIEALNEKDFKSKPLFVGRAQKKSERLEELKNQYESSRLENLIKSQGVNLYIKNLNEAIDDEKLREEFQTFGTITSVKVMRDENGKSKGFGFVSFSSPEEATKATAEMNGTMLMEKPLYVALAQPKEARRSHLQQQILTRNQFRLQQQHQQAALAQGAPGQFIQPLYFNGQQPFLPPGARGAPIPNPQFLVQGVPRPGSQGQGQWQGRPLPNGQPIYGIPPFQDFQGRNQRGYYNNRGGPNRLRNNRDEFAQQQQQPQGINIAQLAQDLPNLPEEDQKRVLGDQLYGKVVATGPSVDSEFASKITGMLLDLPNNEILDALANEEVFQQHFSEAIQTYQEAKNLEASGESEAPAQA
jgi:polyadenylate-binding protein